LFSIKKIYKSFNKIKSIWFIIKLIKMHGSGQGEFTVVEGKSQFGVLKHKSLKFRIL